MSSNTLNGLGRSLLEAIHNKKTSVTFETLASEFDASEDALRERIRQLEQNALIRTGGHGYEVTENGLRVLKASPRGVRNNEIDTLHDVEHALEKLSLRPDKKAAVRSAFVVLRYWGGATTAELINATYSEFPAGYKTAERWWHDCVRDALESLPEVHRSSDEVTTWWHYDGTPMIDALNDEDGRTVATEDSNRSKSAPSVIGSVRHGFEELELREEERIAARVAFAVLCDLGEASTETLVDRVFEHYSAEYDSRDAWGEKLSSILERLPEIEGDRETDDEIVWRYRPSFPEDGGHP